VDNPVERRGGFSRGPGARGDGIEGAAGIVIADSVDDRPEMARPSGRGAPAGMNDDDATAAKPGWTSIRAKSAGRAQNAAEGGGPARKADQGEAPIPRSRLGRSRNTDAARAPRIRRARLKIVNLDPWSVMKVAFLFSIALGLIFLVAVALLWTALDLLGFFSTVGSTVSDVSGGQHSSGFDVVSFFSLPRVMGMATILVLIDTIVITALATLASYLYNLSTEIVGGVEVTLAEEE
jgi:hypothetical protein